MSSESLTFIWQPLRLDVHGRTGGSTSVKHAPVRMGEQLCSRTGEARPEACSRGWWIVQGDRE